MKIYLHNGKPILIEKEAKVVSKKYFVDGNFEKIDIFSFSKTYIKNWNKNKFVYMLWNKTTNQYEHQKGDGFDIMFKGEKLDIIRILKLSEFAIIGNSE